METEYEDEIQDIFESPSAFAHIPINDKHKGSVVDSHKQMPFNLQWIYGLNENTPIINMNMDNRNQVFFAAAYNGILYDYISKKMDFLQGHRNIITNIARDGSGKILVTADSGEDNCVNIWNSETLQIVKTILQPHETYELEKMSLSIDAKYFLTFGYEEKPTIKLWNWLDEENELIAKIHVEVPNRDVVNIIFDPSCSKEFCMALERKLIFGYITIDGNKYNIHLRKCLVKATFSDYGNFQCMTYNVVENQLLACTNKGYLAIFKSSFRPEGECKFLPKVFIKIVKIEKRGIVVIKDCDGFIVVCNEDKQIHIYSTDIRILHKFDDFDLGDIKALSFNMTPNNCQEGKDSLSIRLTLSKRKWKPQTFIQRDAYINLRSEGIGLVDFINQKFYNIIDGFRKIIAIAIHPERTLVCVGDILGKIQLIDFENKLIMSSGNLPYEINCENEKLRITCLKFPHSGAFLVCGVNNGDLWLFDAMLLQLVSTEPLKYSKSSIKQIEFSQDSIFMAASNAVGYIFLYKYDCNASLWKFIGKEKAHCKPVINIIFESSEILKLLTVGEDRIVNVYKIELLENGETEFDKMKTVKIEKYAATNSIVNEIWPEEKGLLITASDDYKYKVYDYKTERILATYLGPKYTSPVLKMLKLPSPCGDAEYMVFCTQKHIGIQKFPLDGNPFKQIAMLGHPIKVNDFIITRDGKTLFTSGEGDYNFLQWSINTIAAEVSTLAGGEGINPFATLIEGGKSGWIFGQLRVLFYYAQIICQGESTPYLRKISDVIPASTLPDIMRAIGYYPTEFEIKSLTNEVNYHIFNTTVNNNVSFEEFVKLYVNYRPAFGDPFCKYEDAFKEFVDRQRDGSVKLHKSVLISALTTYGENVTDGTIKKILQILASQIAQKDKTEKFTLEEIDALVPKAMSMDFFFGDLLGFNLNDLYNQQNKSQ